MVLIESENNKLIKHIKSLDTKKGRDKHDSFIIEGEKFVDSIPHKLEIESYVLSQTMYSKVDIEKYSSRAKTYVIKDSIFKSISDTIEPQGIFAICKKVKYALSDVLDTSRPLFILMIEESSDPGNLGTIIRTAESAGACGVLVSENSVDLYNKKVLRATAGAIFHIPIVENVDLIDACKIFKSHGVEIVATHLKGAISPYDINLQKDCAVVVGNESRGVSDKLIENIDHIVKIPMIGDSESLNVSVASGILLYEVVRQRLKKI